VTFGGGGDDRRKPRFLSHNTKVMSVNRQGNGVPVQAKKVYGGV
jgi:hypothetical protein